MESHEIITIEQDDSRYPWVFRALGDDMPPRIYVRGNIELLRHPKIVAIIGSRKTDQTAIGRAFDIAAKYVDDGYVIVSGAHMAACLYGRTIAIVATGLDMVYPKKNEKLCKRIIENGGLVLSEQPPGTKATPSRLVARTRLQAALANPVVVIQAALQSETMYAVDYARKYGKTLLACRYDTYNAGNAGNRYLLENGIATNVSPGFPPLSENELRLIRLEEAWHDKQHKMRIEELLEWNKHPLSKNMSYAFMAANEIDCLSISGTETEIKSIEEDYADYLCWCRHGMSKEDWSDYRAMIDQQQFSKWYIFIQTSGAMSNYDSHEIFRVLQFKIDRMIDYWLQFSHAMNGDYVRSQIELASRLLQILIENGNEGEDIERLPARVNLKNKKRFEVRFLATGFYLGEEQEIRYKKAYNLLFKLLKENILLWRD